MLQVAGEGVGRAGAVQHGASTVPPGLFGHFPDHDCAEIHLATEFQNMVYDHPSLPLPLKRQVERCIFDNFGTQRAPGETENQFLYKNRKQSIWHFKKEFWNIPACTRTAISGTVEKNVSFIVVQLLHA